MDRATAAADERASALSARYPHLKERAAALVDADRDTRVADILRDRWLGYTAAQLLMEDIEDLMCYPRTSMTPNLLIIGAGRNGKTSIIHRLRRRHPPQRLSDGRLSVPIVHFDMPSPVRETDFWHNFLRAMRIRGPASASATTLRMQTEKNLEAIDCRLVVVDELHHLLAADRRSTYDGMIGMLKNLSNMLEAPMVFLGTETAIEVISRNAEMGGRVEIAELPRWKLDATFTKFLSNLESTLPFPEPSNLGGPDLSRLLYDYSEDGIIGWVVRRIQLAAIRAIDTGKPCIGATELESVTMRSLAERRSMPKF